MKRARWLRPDWVDREAPMQEITLRRLLAVAGKHWGLIAGACWLGTAAAAYLTVFILTPIYQSTAVVLVKPRRE